MNTIINPTETLLEAYRLLNELSDTGGNLTLFVVDVDNHLLGSLTDGDIRRFILNGGKLDDVVTKAMYPNCKVAVADDEDFVKQLHNLRKSGIKAVPIVDNNNCIQEILDLTSFKSHLPIDAVLMAGGKGERLRPLTEKTPKPLVNVGDKCIIDYNVDRLIEFGVKHINVTINYLGEQIEEHFSQPINNVQVRTIREPKFLGTIGSIKFVDAFHNDTILVMNSDILTDIDYEDFYLHFIENNADMSVAAIPYFISIPYGVLELEGRIIKGLTEKPKYNYYANAGIYLIKKSALNEIPDNEFFNATDLIEKLIAQDKKVIRYPHNGIWIDIGTPQEYDKAKEVIKHINL